MKRTLVASAISALSFSVVAGPSAHAQPPSWSGKEQRLQITAEHAGVRSTLEIRCEPSASGGRTIPSVALRTEVPRSSSLNGAGPNATVQLRVRTNGSRPYVWSPPPDDTYFSVEGGSRLEVPSLPVLEVVGHAGADVNEAAAAALLAALNRASQVTIQVRVKGGSWASYSFPARGLRAALRASWCA